MLVHLLSAGESPSPRNEQRGVEAEKSVGQENVGPQRPLPRDHGLLGPHAGRLVPVRRPSGTPSDRCATYLPQGRPAGRSQEVVEDHVLLRRSEVSRARCCEVRPSWSARFDREQRRRSRGSVPCRFTEDGSRAGVALVRDAGDVPQGGLPHCRTSRDERCSHAENDCTSTLKETLIADLQYSARGPVDQLEDRYLGMVEAVGSNPTRSTFRRGEVIGTRGHVLVEVDQEAVRGETVANRSPKSSSNRRMSSGPMDFYSMQ